jgi:hypothetical protein
MLVVEQRLTNHHAVVAQLFQDKPHATLHENPLELGGDRANPPDEAASDVEVSDARVSREDTLSDRNRPLPLRDMHERSSDQTTQPIIEELHDKGEAGGFVLENNMEHENLQPMATTSQGSRLHLSDFIQNLSE